MGMSSSTYTLSAHARDRMVKRDVTESEVLFVLEHPSSIDQANGYGRIAYRGRIGGRSITVLIEAFTCLVITVFADSRRGFFSIGATVEDEMQARLKWCSSSRLSASRSAKKAL
jgi:hypothetical protein